MRFFGRFLNAKMLAVLLALVLAASLSPGLAAATSGTTYYISSASDLNNIRSEMGPNNTYELMNDVDLSVYSTDTNGGSWTGWDPIGDDSSPFEGTFEGNGYTISGLYISASGNNLNYAGLFGYIDGGAVVDSVYLQGVSINCPDATSGGLAGQNYGSITGCYATGSINSSSIAGGLVGVNNGSITGCYATGSINSSGTDTGGLVGINTGGLIADCYTNDNISGSGSYDGGLAGGNYANGSITDCYATGSVSVSGACNGGLVGENNASITGCYATGSVSSGDVEGGIVSVNSGSITDCYATGSVSGSGSGDTIGGLVGVNESSINSSYWDTDTTGQSAASGTVSTSSNSDNNGRMTTQMQQENTFTIVTSPNVAWSFTGVSPTWGINEGYSYPYLLQTPPTPLPTVTASASGGTVNGVSPYVGTYDVSDAVYLIAAANSGYNFSEWTGGGSTVTSAVYNFTMPAGNVSLTANFTGSLSAGATSATLPTGTAGTSYDSGGITQYLTASGGTAPYSYSASGLPQGLSMSAGGEIAGTPNAAFNGNITVTVTDNSTPQQSAQVTLALVISQAASYTVSTTVSPTGAGTVSGNNSPYTAGSSVSLTATPNSGYTFSQWTDTSGNLVSTANPYSFTMPANNVTLVAVFTATTTLPAGGGGGGAQPVLTPIVQTGAATSVTATSAVLSGDITSDNNYDVTDYGFLWGTSDSSLTNKLDVGASNISGGFTDTLSGLTAGTTYYFQAYATNSQGTADGAVMSFTTTGTAPTTTPTTPAAPTFSDVPSSYWAYTAITSLSGQGIISGYPDGTFRPGNPITRAEFATMLVKALGLSTTGTNGTFTDVTPGDWCYNSVSTAVYANLVYGIGDHLFAPNALVTREQMAVMVAKAMGDKAPAVNGTELDAFSDKADVSDWAVTGMEEAVKAGIVSGITPTTLAPLSNATRAEAAAMIYKLLGFLGK